MRCTQCGYVNPNHIDKCLKCGNSMANVNVQNQNPPQQNIPQSKPNNDLVNNNNNNQNNYQNTNSNNYGNFQQNNNFQPKTSYTSKSKNMAIAIILGFILTGLGHAYDELYLRAVICFGIGILLAILSTYLGVFFRLISYAWIIYTLYDVYLCTNAINQGSAIPKFLNYFDLEKY